MTNCSGCGAELDEDSPDLVIIKTNTENAESTGFDDKTVRDHFGRNPPLVVCGSCAERFRAWDVERVKTAVRLARGK